MNNRHRLQWETAEFLSGVPVSISPLRHLTARPLVACVALACGLLGGPARAASIFDLFDLTQGGVSGTDTFLAMPCPTTGFDVFCSHTSSGNVGNRNATAVFKDPNGTIADVAVYIQNNNLGVGIETVWGRLYSACDLADPNCVPFPTLTAAVVAAATFKTIGVIDLTPLWVDDNGIPTPPIFLPMTVTFDHLGQAGAVPEPGTLALFGLGLCGLGLLRRWRSRMSDSNGARSLPRPAGVYYCYVNAEKP